MASAIDDSPVRALVSLKRRWRSPLEAYSLCLAWYRASTSRQEDGNGQIYRTGRACVKLHASGGGPGREAGIEGIRFPLSEVCPVVLVVSGCPDKTSDAPVSSAASMSGYVSFPSSTGPPAPCLAGA